jgi:cytochrome c553
MKRSAGRWLPALLAAVAVVIPQTVSSNEPPPWAYAVNPPGSQMPPDDGVPRRVPGSDRTFSITQLRDLFGVPDWHAADHPAMPEPVGKGRRPDALACGFCHLPNGMGRPENSSLAGLPAEYIVQQVADFRTGARKSSEPRSLPVNFMIRTAKAATEEEVKVAAAYFASLPTRRWIRVVETPTVPTTHVAGWMLVATEPAGTELIGSRIIEMPEDLERTELRDSLSGFVAYVPPGSVERGRALATEGTGRTVACAVCHGAELKGLGPVPALAGRSPSYIVRQLHDLRNGNRNGLWASLMKRVVAGLSDDDIVDLAAYTASLAP